jgi:hypothetical protein
MLFATVLGGKKIGTRLQPHLFPDNRYRVQLGKKGPYIPVSDYREIPSYLANGYSLQMSNRDNGHNLSLVRPQSIQGWSVNSQDLFFPTR